MSWTRNLKPCPFCGANPHRNRSKQYALQNGDVGQDFIIVCPKGHARVSSHEIKFACEEWNRRAPVENGRAA